MARLNVLLIEDYILGERSGQCPENLEDDNLSPYCHSEKNKNCCDSLIELEKSFSNHGTNSNDCFFNWWRLPLLFNKKTKKWVSECSFKDCFLLPGNFYCILYKDRLINNNFEYLDEDIILNDKYHTLTTEEEKLSYHLSNKFDYSFFNEIKDDDKLISIRYRD